VGVVDMYENEKSAARKDWIVVLFSLFMSGPKWGLCLVVVVVVVVIVVSGRRGGGAVCEEQRR